MNREDFKIVPNYYSTTSLTYILYKDVPLAYVEIFSNYGYVETEGKFKSTKKKRSTEDIKREADSLIKFYLNA